jgi:ubiquinone/menaquinone biosynthesis C-methylase UbiE
MQTQEQIWDAIAQNWQEYKKVTFQDVDEFLRGKKGRILDLGCGSGRNFSAFPKDVIICGVDFSRKMLEFAEQEAEKLQISCLLFKAEAFELPFEDNFFDAAIFVATLHCIDSAEKREKALKELFRVLKPESRLFLTCWSKTHARIKGKTKDQIISWAVDEKRYERYYYIYDKEELESLLKKVGFKILSSEEDKNIILVAEKP